MILKDLECIECNHVFEDMVPSEDERVVEREQNPQEDGSTWGYKDVRCPACGSWDVKIIFYGHSALVCAQIIPIYPGCKRHKAGYTHTSHADQKATRYQIGYGGFQGEVPK